MKNNLDKILDELNIIKKHYTQLANNSKFKYTELENNYFNDIENALKAFKIIVNFFQISTCNTPAYSLIKYNEESANNIIYVTKKEYDIVNQAMKGDLE